MRELLREAAMRYAIDWKLLDTAAPEPVRVGDVVSAEPGGMPIYRVVAVEGERVRLDDERRATRVMPLGAFRWRGAAAA